MAISTNALELANIVETFLTELSTHNFIAPCGCCGFPVPAPFINEDTNELLCRNCRTAHENGEH